MDKPDFTEVATGQADDQNAATAGMLSSVTPCLDVQLWAEKRGISLDTLSVLGMNGFVTMDAIKLIKPEDMVSMRIGPLGSGNKLTEVSPRSRSNSRQQHCPQDGGHHCC